MIMLKLMKLTVCVCLTFYVDYVQTRLCLTRCLYVIEMTRGVEPSPPLPVEKKMKTGNAIRSVFRCKLSLTKTVVTIFVTHLHHGRIRTGVCTGTRTRKVVVQARHVQLDDSSLTSKQFTDIRRRSPPVSMHKFLRAVDGVAHKSEDDHVEYKVVVDIGVRTVIIESGLSKMWYGRGDDAHRQRLRGTCKHTSGALPNLDVGPSRGLYMHHETVTGEAFSTKIVDELWSQARGIVVDQWW